MKKLIAALFAAGMFAAVLSAAETQVYNANFKKDSVAWSPKKEVIKVQKNTALIVDVIGHAQSIQIGTQVPAGLEAGKDKSLYHPQCAEMGLDCRNDCRFQSRSRRKNLHSVHTQDKSGLPDPCRGNGTRTYSCQYQSHGQQRENFQNHQMTDVRLPE